MSRLRCAIVLLLLTACGGSNDAAPRADAGVQRDSGVPTGRYETDSLVALGHRVELELKSGGRAVLTRHFSGRESVEDKGTYTADGLNLMVTFPAQDSTGPATFRWRLVMSRLVPVDWDRAVYGPAGLTLHHR